MKKTAKSTTVDVVDSTGNGAETPGVDVTYQDKDGVENRERVEPENGLTLEGESRQVKKKKHSMSSLIAEPFVRENTVRDIVYMDRLQKTARGFT